MKTSKIIIIATIALVAFVIITSAVFTQASTTSTPRKELRTLLKQYHDQNIQPKLQTWKEQLDAAMSTADLEKLNTLRAEAQQSRSEMIAKKREMRDNWQQNNPNCNGEGLRKRDGSCDGTGVGRGNGEGMRKRDGSCDGTGVGRGNGEGMRKRDGSCAGTGVGRGNGDGNGRNGINSGRYGNQSQDCLLETQKFANEIKPIAEKYKSILSKIANEAKPEVEKWRKETQNIIDNWKNEHKDEIAKFRGNRSERSFDGWGGMPRGPRFDFDNQRNTARFMLWNGNQNNPIAEELLEADDLTITNLRNSPNPFSDATTIRFELDKETMVTLTILDNKGDVITTLLNKIMPAGEHSMIYTPGKNGKSIPNGTYFYKLQTSNFSETGKMILVK